MTYADVVRCISLLDSSVAVVLPSQLVQRVVQNVRH
jgi:hypothetical protein